MFKLGVFKMSEYEEYEFEEEKLKEDAKQKKETTEQLEKQSFTEAPEKSIIEEQERVVIIDIGECYVKVGFAGDEKPYSVLPTIVGKEKYKQVMVDVSGHTSRSYVGKDCMNMRGVLKITYPISRGNIMDWDSYFAILTHIFYNELRVDPSHLYVLYAEHPLTPLETKQYIAKVLFETYRVKKLFIVSSPLLALFSAGLTSGIVVESGEGLTTITPIIEGKIIEHAIQKLYLAGADVNENLKAWLLKIGVNISGISAIRELLRDIKEKNCFISLSPSHSGSKTIGINQYSMPDGSTIDITMDVRVNAPEILFHPEILGYNSYSIPQAIIESIKRVDRSYWRILLKNIILSGGNTMFYGLEPRLEKELYNLLPELGPLPPSNLKSQQSSKRLVNLQAEEKIQDTCPKCGTRINLTESKYCPNCGSQFETPKIEIPVIELSKFPDKCPSCFKQLKEAANFCPYCGSKIEQLSTDNSIAIEAPEFVEEGGKEGIIRIITPNNRAFAIFNGGSILGAIPSVQNLFITYEQFLADPNCLEQDFSKIF